jgi:hypothetical protein
MQGIYVCRVTRPLGKTPSRGKQMIIITLLTRIRCWWQATFPNSVMLPEVRFGAKK